MDSRQVGRWYPDILDTDGKLTVKKPKPYWQSGWLKQHDRLIQAMSEMKGRTPLVISGDMHAIAIGRMLRSGTLDLKSNPVHAVLSGPIGTGATGWPSTGMRGTPALPPAHLDLDESVKPIEQNGFTIVDFTPDKMVLRFYKWDAKSRPPEAIDRLEAFHTTELVRPA
jgi:phosphodiesterase/alkaline phosphatase D-like protein